jgi:two-component system, cell cycle sensor histidine kinase and response regulator CckA
VRDVRKRTPDAHMAHGPRITPAKTGAKTFFGTGGEVALGVTHDAGRPSVNIETILLVEDDPAVRQLFAQALSRAGYTVYEARNGEEAVKLFDQHGDSIDLLLTDMRMPYMGGAELARQLRARRETLKLLCISGYPGAFDGDLAADFLAKPFSRDDLLNKVREVLDRR